MYASFREILPFCCYRISSLNGFFLCLADYDPSIYRPMQPVLTMRATRETPKLGSNTFLKSLPATYPAFLASQSIKSLKVDNIQEPHVQPDEVLYV
jgi:hypothetical protein